MDLKSIEANIHSTGYSDFHFINNQGKQFPFTSIKTNIFKLKIMQNM